MTPEQTLGLGLVLAVSIIWVLASFLVQDLEHLGVHPVVVTCVSNSLFAIYLPVYLVSRSLGVRSAAPKSGPDPAVLDQCPENEYLPSISEWRRDWRDALQVLWDNQLFKAALHVAPLWFFAQLTFNASLSMTSVTSNTILSSTSALFTFLFSVMLLSERFTYSKLGCILGLMVGTGMVTMSDGISGAGGQEYSQDSIWGDLLCLVSAALYGMYTVSIRIRIRGDDESVPMTLFFAFMGLLIALTTGPVLLVLAIAGAPLGSMSLSIFGVLILKGCLDNVLSDWMWARAILLIGPTLATSGLALQVPIAVVSDVLISHPAWLGSLRTILLTTSGGMLILGFFFALVMGDVGGESQQRSNGALDI